MAKTDERLFAPFPIEMDEHPKIFPLSDAAFRALFEATFYSRRMMSDGFLDERVVLKRWGQAVADELSGNDPNRPSWIPTEGGWRIHDFEKHHPLRADIEEKREAVRVRRVEAGKRGGQASGEARAKQTASKPEANVSTDEAKRTSETETETETETTPKGVERPAKRGSRLSAEWLPSPASIAKAREDAPAVDHQAEHATFIDYWIAQPGQRGVKTDWDATWRNWMRRKQGDVKTRPVAVTPTKKALDVIEMGRRMQADEDRKAIE